MKKNYKKSLKSQLNYTILSFTILFEHFSISVSFKGAVCTFRLFVAISVWNVQLFAEFSFLRGLCISTAPAWMNLMFWGLCVCQFVSHWFTDSSLSWTYDPKTMFTGKCPSEPVTCLPLLFWPTEEKTLQDVTLSMVIKSKDCLAHHIKPCKWLCFVLKMFLLTSALRDCI